MKNSDRMLDDLAGRVPNTSSLVSRLVQLMGGVSIDRPELRGFYSWPTAEERGSAIIRDGTGRVMRAARTMPNVSDYRKGHITMTGTVYEIQTRHYNGRWHNISAYDDVPMTFATREEAEQELAEHLDCLRDAYGDDPDHVNPDDYRIRERGVRS